MFSLENKVNFSSDYRWFIKFHSNGDRSKEVFRGLIYLTRRIAFYLQTKDFSYHVSGGLGPEGHVHEVYIVSKDNIEKHQFNQIIFEAIFNFENSKLCRTFKLPEYDSWKELVQRIPKKDQNDLLQDLLKKNLVSKEFYRQQMGIPSLKNLCLETICEKIEQMGQTDPDFSQLPIAETRERKVANDVGKEINKIMLKDFKKRKITQRLQI